MADKDISTLGAEIEVAYAGEVPQVTGAEKTAGTETGLRTYSPKDVADMATTHGPSAAMTLLGTETVAGAAATSFTISGLNFSAYKAFRLYVEIDNALGSVINVLMYYNSDTTAGNYNSQVLTVDSTTVSAAAFTDGVLHSMHANALMNMVIDITRDVNGQPRAMMTGNEDAGNVEIRSGSHRWDSAANITSITIQCSLANGLDVGSGATLYGIA